MDVITRLRQRTVPAGHSFHTWCPGELGRKCYGVSYHVTLSPNNAGKTETPAEIPRSIVAQLHYHHNILKWESEGVPFCSHAYVPEDHPLTGVPFHEREDETYVFKVSTNNTCMCVCTGACVCMYAHVCA